MQNNDALWSMVIIPQTSLYNEKREKLTSYQLTLTNPNSS